MASYKVIQDIEAEDKLVGPLTLRQFVYAAIAGFCAYLSFMALTHDFGIALVVLGPPMVFTGFFAFPWGRDQPTEVWALAKIRYYLKSRKRIWNQSGVKELVTITAPKRETKIYTNGLSVPEVQSRLSALASTLDTRGWAVKNVYTPPILNGASDNDRLLSLASLPRSMPVTGVTDADDMLDEANNPRAHQLGEMVDASTADHKRQLLERMRHAGTPVLPQPVAAAGNPAWFTKKPLDIPQPATAKAPVQAAAVPAEAELDTVLHQQHALAQATSATENLKTIEPLHKVAPRPPATAVAVPVPAPVTPQPDPATISLSTRDDLNITTIARMAKGQDKDTSSEVVISLHNHD